MKLTHKGRWIYVEDIPNQKVYDAIVKEFSYQKKGSEFMANPEWAWVRLFQKGKKRFPIGLLNRFYKLMESEGVYVEKLTLGNNLVNFKEKSDGLYDFQVSALRMFLTRRGGIFQIPTGGGKTRTALACINTINAKTLVVVPTIDLKKQWNSQIGDNTVVQTYQSLKSKSFIQQFDLIVFDECHNVAAKTLQKIGLNLKESAITLGLSATPFMRDDDNLKVESIIGPVIYKISLRELIAEGYLVDALVHYHKLENMDTTFMDYPMAYDEYIMHNLERNDIILNLAKESKGHTLILVKKIEHGENLCKALTKFGEDVVFLNGGSKKEIREDTNHRIIIATSIFDEGIDIPHLKNLILAGGGKSAIKTTQRIGRVLRKFPGKEMAIVHDFNDNCKWLQGHSHERRKIYKKDFEVVDVE